MAFACPFSKPPHYHCKALPLAKGGFAKRCCTFRPQVANNEREKPARLNVVKRHLASQHGVEEVGEAMDADVSDYLILMGEGGFVDP